MFLLRHLNRIRVPLSGFSVRKPLVRPSLRPWAVAPCGVRQYGAQDVSPNQTTPQPGQETPDPNEGESKEDEEKSTAYKMFESAATTFASIVVLGYDHYPHHDSSQGLLE